MDHTITKDEIEFIRLAVMGRADYEHALNVLDRLPELLTAHVLTVIPDDPRCSNCDESVQGVENFCPWCGARFV